MSHSEMLANTGDVTMARARAVVGFPLHRLVMHTVDHRYMRRITTSTASPGLCAYRTYENDSHISIWLRHHRHLLAAIGISGVFAYSVAQRTNEIGIRMSLGAQPADVLRLVIWQGMKLVALGLAVGAVGGYALKRLLASQYFASGDWPRQMAEQLYGVEGTDPATF